MRRLRASVLSSLFRLDGLTAHFQQLDRYEGLDARSARYELGQRMLAQLRYFARRGDALPEWRHLDKLKSVDDLWSAWRDLPILTKADLRERFHPDRIRRDTGVRGVSSTTGGSTGEPTPYLHDNETRKALRAAGWYCKIAMGWRPGVPILCLWGSERDIGKSRSPWGRMTGVLKDFHLVDSYRPTGATIDAVLRLIDRKQPVAMYGFTSLLEYVARGTLARNRTIEPGTVTTAWNGGEMLFDEQVGVFRAAFGVPILNLYGGRELGAMAYQSSTSARMRVLRPFVLMELLRDDGHEASPGEVGRIVVSSLVCRGTPFLRYEIGDLGSYADQDRDESGIRSIERLYGRSAGVIRLPGGQLLHTLFWNHLFKDYPEVERFQVAIRDAGLELRLKGRGFAPERECALRSVLDKTLPGSTFAIAWLPELPQTSQGKLLQVVDERSACPPPL